MCVSSVCTLYALARNWPKSVEVDSQGTIKTNFELQSDSYSKWRRTVMHKQKIERAAYQLSSFYHVLLSVDIGDIGEIVKRLI